MRHVGRCDNCGSPDTAYLACYACTPVKKLKDYTSAEIAEELKRRRNERKKQHHNARVRMKMEFIEKEIGKLQKEIEGLSKQIL